MNTGPTFLIIGAARCGTSWITKNLRLHPNIFMPNEKEIHFFDRGYEKGLNYYESIFEGYNQKARGEATPAYLYFPSIPQRIHHHYPNIKLIVSLRNPTDRAYSHFWNLKAKAKPGDPNYSISFERKLQATPRLIEEGFYYDMLKRYFDIFPSENILIVFYEEILSDPIGMLNRICRFLDVEDNFYPPIIEQKVNAASNKLGKSNLVSRIYAAMMKFGLYKSAALVEKLNRKPIPRMKSKTRQRLTENVFHPQIELLEKLINVDLDHWK
jgi:hypothetical protein